MDYNDYLNKGIAFFENYEYGPALENLRAAQRLYDSPQIQNVINLVEKAANANAQKKYTDEQHHK